MVILALELFRLPKVVPVKGRLYFNHIASTGFMVIIPYIRWRVMVVKEGTIDLLGLHRCGD